VPDVVGVPILTHVHMK